MFYSIFSSLLAAVILSNIVLQGVGLNALEDKESNVKRVFVRSSILALLAFVVYLLIFVLSTFVLIPFNLTFLNLLVITMMIIGVNELYRLIVTKTQIKLPLDEKLGLHSVLFIVGFMGLTSMAFLDGIVIVLGSLIGYVLFASFITIIQSRIRINPVLKGFKGLPMLLIIIGLIAMILSGLGGIL